ncbi:hypothetical protein C8Q73DRAFT_749459 [Cubamyces lactineus]|nr:hypothetical protein C8Q73DRAFT_749459 [Cubamyces lactineus]
MRQRGMSEEDNAFRVALANMRYASCTPVDLHVLRSRPVMSLQGFEDVSIITARNSHRDAINDEQAERFAAVEHRPLHYFHSFDTWGRVKDSKEYTAVSDPVQTSNKIGARLQHALWSLTPSLCGHHAGILALCEEMPVLLKANEATELSATNGAPGFVAGWESHCTASGVEVLDVLFVRLANPSEPVQIAGLPPNVVPITRQKRSVRCTLPVGDITVSVVREQVPCLQNFALTDYACQGLTRARNVVHPKYCRNHQSLYTALSRSSSLLQTVIIEGLDASKITCGAFPALLNEFCELELLDDISSRSVEGTLPLSVQGTSRSELIPSYLCILPAGMSKVSADAPALQRHAMKPRESRKRTRLDEVWVPAMPDCKRVCMSSEAVFSHPQSGTTSRCAIRQGLLWDATDWSCAYDAILTIMWNLRVDLGAPWLEQLPTDNVVARQLVSRLNNLPVPCTNLESVRDSIRDTLSILNPELFPRRGFVTAAVSDVLHELFRCPRAFASSQGFCTSCSTVVQRETDLMSSYLWCPTVMPASTEEIVSTSQSVIDHLLTSTADIHCPDCRTSVEISTTVHSPPPLICLEVSHVTESVYPVSVLTLSVNGRPYQWHLRGVIYHGFAHFTA